MRHGERLVEDAISMALIDGTVKPGGKAELYVSNGSYSLRKVDSDNGD